MKRGTPEHPKTKHLARLLGVKTYAAVGILEMLWAWTSRYAIRGNPGRWPDHAIADAIGWDGDAGTLIQALVESGWLDRAEEPHRLVIHDIAHHADNTWKQNLADAKLTWWNDEPPRSGKPGRPAKENQSPESCGKPPQPEPEPEPEPQPQPGSIAAALLDSLEKRGLSVSKARHWVAVSHPDDLAEIIAFFDRSLASKRGLGNPPGALKTMLEEPQKKWHFTVVNGRLRAPGAGPKPPENPNESTIRLRRQAAWDALDPATRQAIAESLKATRPKASVKVIEKLCLEAMDERQ